jgi:hypothetical protein
MHDRLSKHPNVEAECPECGLRVRVGGETYALGPERCTHAAGWMNCPRLKPSLSTARQANSLART